MHYCIWSYVFFSHTLTQVYCNGSHLEEQRSRPPRALSFVSVSRWLTVLLRHFSGCRAIDSLNQSRSRTFWKSSLCKQSARRDVRSPFWRHNRTLKTVNVKLWVHFKALAQQQEIKLAQFSSLSSNAINQPSLKFATLISHWRCKTHAVNGMNTSPNMYKNTRVLWNSWFLMVRRCWILFYSWFKGSA